MTHLRPIIPVKIFNDKNVTPIMLKLYIFINEQAFTGGCTKSTATLAKELNIAEQNIRTYIKKLIDAGYIIRHVRNNNERILTLPALQFKEKKNFKKELDFTDFRNILRDFVAKNEKIVTRDEKYVLCKDKHDNIRILDYQIGFVTKDFANIIWHEMYKEKEYYLNKYIEPLKQARIKKFKQGL